MLGGALTDLSVTVLLLFLTQSRAQNDFSLVTLPQQRTSSEYVSRCFYDTEVSLLCDWTKSQTRSAQEDIAVTVLASDPLEIEGQACVEFWYLNPVTANGSELQVQLKSSTGLGEIWASPALPRDAWRQVFVPLALTEPGIQVVFEAVEAASTEEQIQFKQIGIRRGSCGPQCESNTEVWTDESTRCLCTAGQLSCSPSRCPQGQNCGPSRGGSGGSATSGLCTIHHHTDCSTFDGVLFRFMAPCTYVLAKSCSPAEALPLFNVEVVNEQNGNSSLPSVQRIVVDVGNVRVSLLKKQTQRVVVNGVWRKLPLSLSGGTVTIRSNPAAVVLQTRFGLSVSYDTAGAVQVALPPSYFHHACGLCGNFNNLKDDDLRKPDGTNAEDATALAASWQTGDSTSSCETILLPYQCNQLEEAEYASELYCGSLVSGSGLFADCSSVLAAVSYFRACLFSMCSSHGDPAVLCQVLQSYADICQEAGVAVPTWRNSSFCSLQCGANSHYNSCADGCPEVCSAQDLPGSCGNCEERCECDPGFKLSGGECVPEGDCGCWYNEKHYEKGETLTEGECVQRCRCMGNNEIQCSRMTCSNNEVCKVKDGVKGCFPLNPATCSVYGDPHYITFDRFAYDFQGGCSYTLATTCVEESAVRFSIIGHNKHPSGQNATRSKLDAVTLQVEDLRLTLNQSKELFVHDTQLPVPYSTNGSYGSVKVHMKDKFMVLETTFGLRMMLDGGNRLFLQVDECYKYELCGLCGTYSGYQDDDLVTPGGQNVTDPFKFGDSWIVQDSDECIRHPNAAATCDDDLNNLAYDECSTIFGDAFTACHEHIHPSVYLNSCVYDYCVTNGDPHTLCESLKSYAAACRVAGVKLPVWEIGTACAEPQTTATPPTTSSPTPQQNICPLNCNFDEHLCGWKQLIQDSFDWTRRSGPTPSDLTGPNQDHTTGAGSYMYIEASEVTHGDSARLLSSACHYSVPVCMNFWYHMYGSAKAMALNIYLLRNNRATKIWSTIENQGPEWHQGNIDISVSSPFQIIVEGIRGSNPLSDVAVDDFSLHFGKCSENFPDLVSGTKYPPTTSVLPPRPICSLDCSFDRSLCSWSQMMTDAFDWTRQSGSTPTLMTGPSADHTGDGHYLYIEASSITHGDTARLISSECQDSGPQCLQFWYHMYGSADTMGLHVYLLQNKVADVVFRQRNDQGNTWHLAQVDIQTTGAFQIIFEGRRGNNDKSDVAIDDVKLYHGRCSYSSGDFNATAPPSVPVPATTSAEPSVLNGTVQPPDMYGTKPPTEEAITDSINQSSLTDDPFERPAVLPVCSLDCSFDRSLCSWSQMMTDAFDWTRQSGSTPTLMTGPTADHTGDGYYLYIEASSVTHGDTARLISSECQDSGPQCLQFWYHMYGSADTMGLHVYLLQNKVADVVFRQRNDQGNTWHLAQVDIQTTGAFQIIFEGRRGSNDKSDVALDDVMLYHGPCSELNSGISTQPPKPVPITTTASGVPLPTTATPETTTTNTGAPVCQLQCDFDGGLCLWTQLLADVFDWTRHHGSTPSLLTGPSSDHTTGGGHYLYIEANSATLGDTARLISSECSDSGPLCLQFWYHMYGSAETMGLHVYLYQDRKAEAIWRKRNNQGNVWHQAQVDLTANGVFQIILEGRRGSNDRSDVAIDDVSLNRGYCADQLKPTRPATTTLASLATITTEHSPSKTPSGTDETTEHTTVGPQPSTTDKSLTQTSPTSQPPTTVGLESETTARPQPPTTVKLESETTAKPQPPTTVEHESYTTARPQPPTTVELESETTARPQPPTTVKLESETTAKPQPPTTVELESETTARPQPPTTVEHESYTTARPQPPTTVELESETTARPQPPTTVELESETTARPQPPTTVGLESETTARPQPPTTVEHESDTTARPQPPTTVELESETTARPQPPTTVEHESDTTARPQPPTTVELESETTARPQPPTTVELESQTTARPQPPTTVELESDTTARPQPPTTVELESETTARPQPPTTVELESETTARPQPPTTVEHESDTTARPQPPTTVELESETTARPQPPTTVELESETTARPQPPTTVKLESDTTARPQPTTTVELESQTTAKPQPPTTVELESETTARPQPPTTVELESETTARPQPPTTVELESETTARSQPPTTVELDSETTARPQPPTTVELESEMTARPQPPTTVEMESQTTARPQPPTTVELESQTTVRPQPPTTVELESETTARPQPTTTVELESETTARSQPTTTVELESQTTARPQPPTTVELESQTTARPQPPTTVELEAETTARPQPPTTVELESETTARPQPTTTVELESETTARSQPTTTVELESQTTARPQPPTTVELESQTTARPQPPTTVELASETTARPQPPTTVELESETTARPQPPTTVELESGTTARPQPTTTVEHESDTTARPQPPTTVELESETTARPQPPTTVELESETTARPQPTTTVKLESETTARPQPTTTVELESQTTAKPQPPTTVELESETTARPQPPTTVELESETTARPQPPTTVELESETTARPQPPTTVELDSETTARPQPPTTVELESKTTARPQPPTTVEMESQTTARPQPPTTVELESQTTARPQPPTTVELEAETTARPQPPTTVELEAETTARPQPPTTVELESETTARPQPPTTTAATFSTTADLIPPLTTHSLPHTTEEPQPPSTNQPQPPATPPPHTQPTQRPNPPTTTQSESQTTNTPQPTSTTTPNLSTTAQSQPTTTTRGPQTTTKPEPTPSCLKNSHYTTCVPACSPTCSNLDGPPGCREADGCLPGCVCNDGFVLKRRLCVPVQACGCVDWKGNKYQFNEEWYTNHCHQKCECDKEDGRGKIKCDDEDECDGNAVCLQDEKGNYYCQSTGFNECSIDEDSEYNTFDKMKYHFEGEHSYVLVRTKNLPTKLPDIYIEAINGHTSEDDGDSEEDQRHTDSEEEDEEEDEDSSEEQTEHHRLQELKIQVYNHTIMFKRDRKLTIDGKRSGTPASPTGGINIVERSSRLYLQTDFGLSVEFDGHGRAEITLPRVYKRKIEGLCGNFDGRKQNERMKPDGTLAHSVKEFGQSWMV